MDRRKRVYLSTQTTFARSTKKNTCPKEFKEAALQLAQKMGVSVRQPKAQACTIVSFDVGKQNYNRKEKSFPGPGPNPDEELGQLQEENQRLKEMVEILEPMLHA